MDSDLFFLELALKQARLACARSEVPVGAVLVDKDGVLAMGFNTVEADHDVSCHAEMHVIRLASKKREDWRLNGTTLYSTLEPCPMCAGAIVNARIDRLVYAAKDSRWGGAATQLIFKPNQFNHTVSVSYQPIQAASDLLRAFFKERRSASKGFEL